MDDYLQFFYFLFFNQKPHFLRQAKRGHIEAEVLSSPHRGACTIKLFTAVIKFHFVISQCVRHHQPSLTFVGKAGAYLSRNLQGPEL
jgi:hypothetical protein